ncbi:MAG: YqgE/AlgH family protein [Gammaproteobacteria bacterium]
MTNASTLTGHLLIAMPSMLDPNFHQTVTYICEHGDNGALGIIINRPLNMDLGDILTQFSAETPGSSVAAQPVVQGGPVQIERGFVLHESSRKWDATVEVANSIYVTTSQDILSALAAGAGPERTLVALGYAGWGAEQLEAEIAENSWLNAPASADLLFDTPFPERWKASAALLGVDLATISTQGGHA